MSWFQTVGPEQIFTLLLFDEFSHGLFDLRLNQYGVEGALRLQFEQEPAMTTIKGSCYFGWF